ncbi:hypothetical protein [Spirosoma agri]|uniref:DUF4968 domain-containing protein n=1 Tax=Spirosoma agri TaxID=1987381 RepID=A0A6M0IMB8_9BACT|nr:hypothetical protein [Spirosoma agri]NEU69460.1 hypothetical protein [Spirosoma agri]
MKKLLSIIFITLLTHSLVNAQAAALVKVNIFNAAAGVSVDIQTANSPEKPIHIKSRTWIIVQTTGDSLALIINKKPYSIHFEPGKPYYFVAQAGPTAHLTMTEKSEREFLLTAAASNARGPEEYTISN